MAGSVDPENILIPGPIKASCRIQTIAAYLAERCQQEHGLLNGKTALYWNIIHVLERHLGRRPREMKCQRCGCEAEGAEEKMDLSWMAPSGGRVNVVSDVVLCLKCYSVVNAEIDRLFDPVDPKPEQN